MTARILTTHVGSLPRSARVIELVGAQDRDEPVDAVEFERVIGEAVAGAVSRQVQSGIDVVSDGEMSKISYATYIRHRLSGFEIDEVPRATPADLDAFPSFKARLAEQGGTPKYLRPVCRGAIRYEHPEPLAADIAHLRAACDGQPVTEAFMNAPSPGVIAVFQPNEFYASDEEYLGALAEAMATEYRAIVDAGLLLQIDAPDLGMGRHIMYRDRSEPEFLAAAQRHLEALDAALAGIPAERVRMHICWGNYEGPHHCDIGVERIIDLVLAAKPRYLLFEGANPRHEHEWEVWAGARIPEDKVLVPGVIDSTTNYIEHPRLVAQRLRRFVDIVGADRVLAGSDCGFGTFAGFGAVDPEICWAKLRSLADGAELAIAGTPIGA
jgi:5-methyltetrahydropteroyltriglutamate--homocysteine methyltransferase